MIEKLILWSILSYGLMNIMVYGSIFSWLREMFKYLSDRSITTNNIFFRILFGIIIFFAKFVDGILSCPMCFSVWGGFFLSVFIYSPTNEFFHLSKNISWFFDGIYSSGIVWSINAIIEWFEETKK